MRATPIQTAVTAVLATATGLLSAWYVPPFALSLAVGAIAYLTAAVVIAKTLRVDAAHHIAATATATINGAIATIHVLTAGFNAIAAFATNALGLWRGAIQAADAKNTTKTKPTYIRAV